MRRSSPLQRRTPLKAAAPPARPRAISPASPEQRAKATKCIVTGAQRDEGWVIDPAHICARAHGGCDDPLCVVGLRRDVHRSFDDGDLDLLPYLLAHRMVPELCHALEHYEGNMPGLLARLTGERWAPERMERAA